MEDCVKNPHIHAEYKQHKPNLWDKYLAKDVRNIVIKEKVKPGKMEHSANPSTSQAEAGGSL